MASPAQPDDLQPSPVDAVVFDLGNVLIRWDPHAAIAPAVGPEEATRFLADEAFAFPEWNHAQDAGRDWQEAEDAAVAAHPHWEPAIRGYRQNFPASLTGQIDDTVALLEELHAAGVRLYALTNWSAELFPAALDRFAFLDLFEDIIVSGEEAVAKPDPEIFEVLEDRIGHALDDCVFIDDSPRNVEAAAAPAWTPSTSPTPGTCARTYACAGCRWRRSGPQRPPHRLGGARTTARCKDPPVSIKDIRLFGDPVLRTPAAEVVDFDKELRQLVKDLTDTMLDAPGAGLAAPQIGVGLRVFTYYVDEQLGHLVNPEPRPVRGRCRRARRAACPSPALLRHPAGAARGRQGLEHARRAGRRIEGTELMARCIQHETDHLDGILFIDRMDRAQRKLAMKADPRGRVGR